MIKTLKILETKKDHSIVDSVTFLSVTFALLDDPKEVDGVMTDNVVDKITHSFPLDSTPEFISGELQKFLDMRIVEEANAIKNADKEKAHSIADQTIEALQKSEPLAPSEEAIKVQDEAVILQAESAKVEVADETLTPNEK